MSSKRRCIVMSVAIAVSPLVHTGAIAQSAVTGAVVRGHYLTDAAGQCKNLTLDFGIRADFVVSRVILFYQPAGLTQYSSTALKRSPTLEYSGQLPCGMGLKYYLEVFPERGPKTYINSSNAPADLDPSLLTVQVQRSSRKGLLIGVLGAGSAIVGAAAVAVAAIGGSGATSPPQPPPPPTATSPPPPPAP